MRKILSTYKTALWQNWGCWRALRTRSGGLKGVIIYREGFCLWGDQNFLGRSRGGGIFFCGPKGGPDFLGVKEGVTKISSQDFLRLRHNSFLDTSFKKCSRLRRNLCLYHSSYPMLCSYNYNHILSQPTATHNVLPPPLFYVTGVFFQQGGPEFFPKAKGGTTIFPCRQRGGGTRIFFAYAKGGGRKNWRPAITNRCPPSAKNDSSLNWAFLLLHYILLSPHQQSG